MSDTKPIIITVLISVGVILAVFGLVVWLEVGERKEEAQYDLYCSSGWNSTCMRVPDGQNVKTDNGCITDGSSSICGTYKKLL